MKIKPDESFEHLKKAPIVEAVLDIRARAQQLLDETSAKAMLESVLTGYRFLDFQQDFEFTVQIKDGPTLSDMKWGGVRFISNDEKQIAKVTNNGILFSCLAPYTNWNDFSAAGLTLWKAFQKIASPTNIHRVGIRYINKIELPANDQRLDAYLSSCPSAPKDFDAPLLGFMHQDVLKIPDHPYAINIVKTIQAPEGPGRGVSIVLDIDVFTDDCVGLDESSLSARLVEMRWLKNKVFFGSITSAAKDLCV